MIEGQKSRRLSPAWQRVILVLLALPLALSTSAQPVEEREIDPSSPRYQEELGDLYVELALEAYAKAMELGGRNGGVEKKLSRLRELIESAKTHPATASREPSRQPPAALCVGAVAAVHDWAEAWSNQAVNTYLASYSADFSPAGLDRDQWEAQRRQRLQRPRFIGIKLVEISVESCAERDVRLSFTQIYRSDTYQDRVRKQLWLTRPGDRWTILGETVIP